MLPIGKSCLQPQVRVAMQALERVSAFRPVSVSMQRRTRFSKPAAIGFAEKLFFTAIRKLPDIFRHLGQAYLF